MTEKPNGGSLTDKVTWVREKLDRQRAEGRTRREQGSRSKPLSSVPIIDGAGKFMSDVTIVELPPVVTDQPHADLTQPGKDADAVTKVTHEVATDDMFKPSA